MKILQIFRAPAGGLFRHVCDLTKSLTNDGHDVGILCDAHTGSARAENELENLAGCCSLGIHRCLMEKMPGIRDFVAIREAKNLAMTLQVDVIHGHGAKGGAYARLAGRKLKKNNANCSVIYTPHGGSLHYNPASLKGFLFLRTESYLRRMTDGMIFESAFSRDRYLQVVGEIGCASSVVHNGVSKNEFLPINTEAGASDFLFIGELRDLKGIQFFIKAIEIINSEGGEQRVKAAIVGKGPDEAKYRTMVEEAGLDDQVSFLGEMPAREAFAKGRCLVIPSLNESLPYIVLEGAAAGMPVIVTDVGGIPEIVGDLKHIMIPPASAELLAEKMNAFIASEKEFRHRSKLLQRRIMDYFSQETMANGIYHLYENSLR